MALLKYWKSFKSPRKILKLEADLKAAKEELKIAYKEQLKAEKAAEAKVNKVAKEPDKSL